MPVVTLAFVDGPASSPAVNETLTASPSWLGSVDDFDLGAPTFEAAPESVGGEYGYRTVSFTLKLVGTYAQVAPKMQTIARQLLAERNWLAVTWGTSTGTPFFLRTYRTAPQGVSWAQSVGGVWLLPVTLVCDPFAYGPEQTIGPQTVTNAAPFYTLPSILGDAPAPLTVSMAPSVDWTGYQVLISVAAYEPGLAPSAAIAKEAESLNLGTDTTVAADAAMSGGSRASTSFATGTQLATRVGGTTVLPYVGVYKVLCRAQKGVVTDDFKVQFAQSMGSGVAFYGPPVIFDRVAASSSTSATWIDLGNYAFPFGSGRPSVGDAGPSIAHNISVVAGRTAGTGALLLDVLHFLPVETGATVQPSRFLKIAFPNVGPTTTQTVELDAEAQHYNLRLTSTGSLMPSSPPLLSGGFPEVVPGATNVFQVYSQTMSTDIPGTTGGGSLVTSGSASYTFSYYPRYLHMRA